MEKITWNDVLENRKRWEAALLSGQYTQTTKVLHNREDGGFCCLGVGCEIVPSIKATAIDGVAQIWKVESLDTKPFAGRDEPVDAVAYGEEEEKQAAPYELVAALGLRGSEGECRNGSFDDTLAALNDRGVSFKDIAERIETGNYYLDEAEWLEEFNNGFDRDGSE